MQQKDFSQKNNPFRSTKTCSECHRVYIGKNFKKRNIFLRILGIPIIYIPFLLGSWIFLYLISLLLAFKVNRSRFLKKLKDFIPDPGIPIKPNCY